MSRRVRITRRQLENQISQQIQNDGAPETSILTSDNCIDSQTDGPLSENSHVDTLFGNDMIDEQHAATMNTNSLQFASFVTQGSFSNSIDAKLKGSTSSSLSTHAHFSNQREYSMNEENKTSLYPLSWQGDNKVVIDVNRFVGTPDVLLSQQQPQQNTLTTIHNPVAVEALSLTATSMGITLEQLAIVLGNSNDIRQTIVEACTCGTEKSRQERALALYRNEKKALLKKSMIVAGYPKSSIEIENQSQDYLQLSIAAWQQEGVELQKILQSKQQVEGSVRNDRNNYEFQNNGHLELNNEVYEQNATNNINIAMSCQQSQSNSLLEDMYKKRRCSNETQQWSSDVFCYKTNVHDSQQK